jgi:hypothetical protein
MSEKPKTTRTVIADLPGVACDLSAEELSQVNGGAGILIIIRGCGTNVPASCTFCNDTDYHHD